MKSEETLLEKYLAGFHKQDVMTYLDTHPNHFEEAVILAIADKQPYSWRAAWMLYTYIQDNDSRVRKYVSKLINTIPGKTDGHQRELLKVLYRMNIAKSQKGMLFNHCMKIWESVNKQPSVRYYALLTMIRIAADFPELKAEIKWMMQEHYMETLTPGVKKSVQKMLNELS